MDQDIPISFKDVDPSDALENLIRREVGRLEHLFPRSNSCRVVVHRPRRHGKHGDAYAVHIHFTNAP
ncbi:MAG: HPF/RaiA family ribosome-associated protein [Rhodospirillaceae bacterium]